ncbi:MAG: cardiolipin synthase [Cyclobacteriaceae bacterium]|nr:MAG: cardiolipin synthase [Cyclobacteriaceae bacterium]
MLSFYLILIAYMVFSLLRENRDPEITLAWVLVLILIPGAGLILYLNFGRNFRKVKIFSRKGLTDLVRIEEISQNQITDLSGIITDGSGSYIKSNIIKLLLNNSKALLTAKNKLEILQDGKATFSSILNALDNAKHHIHMEYYVYEDDHIGNRIKDALIKKAQQGLEVRLIIDAIGSWSLSKRFLRELKNNGVEVGVFMPVRFPLVANKINYRNHRKIVVADGTCGFVGGLNIADRYIDGTPELGVWRDTHLKIEGDAVRSLQTVFITDWYFVTKDYLRGNCYFPPHNINNQLLVQITSSGPDSDWSNIMQAYFTAITTAEKNIYISTPYFMPNESILTALKTAALSGVDVKLILPGHSDVRTTWYGSISYTEELLRAGVHVYLYKKGFNHGKIMMVDGVFTSIGTANMDGRSFNKNFEVNALIYDKEKAEEIKENFLQDIADSEKIHLQEFLIRPRKQKIKESLCRVLGPLY